MSAQPKTEEAQCGDRWNGETICTRPAGHPGLHLDGRVSRCGDGPCQDCGRFYPAWFALHEVWNLVMGGPEATDDPGGLLCPTCFLIRADDVVPIPAWHLSSPPGASS